MSQLVTDSGTVSYIQRSSRLRKLLLFANLNSSNFPPNSLQKCLSLLVKTFPAANVKASTNFQIFSRRKICLKVDSWRTAGMAKEPEWSNNAPRGLERILFQSGIMVFNVTEAVQCHNSFIVAQSMSKAAPLYAVWSSCCFIALQFIFSTRSNINCLWTYFWVGSLAL